jgi:hypothetical protein
MFVGMSKLRRDHRHLQNSGTGLETAHSRSTLVYYLIIMVVVAVAGGTGGLGRSITQAIAKTRKHSVFVLSREAC